MRTTVAAALALLAAGTPAAAGPLTFGVRFTDTAGRVLAAQSGITDTEFTTTNPVTVDVLTSVLQPTRDAGHYVLERDRVEGLLTITDDASGASGTVPLWMEVWRDFERKPDGSLEPLHEGFDHGPWHTPATLVLGTRQYAVTSGDPWSLRVSVTDAPASVATPEPGTLALAGLGAAALGAARTRRRASRSAG